MISFSIPGEVRGKGRPRFVKATGRTFTDAQTVSYENLIKYTCTGAMEGAALASGPVWLSIAVHCAPPASTSAKRRVAMLRQDELPAKKPDLDNIAKLVMDALNGVAWHDDKQVVVLNVSRRYAETSALYVTFREIV